MQEERRKAECFLIGREAMTMKAAVFSVKEEVNYYRAGDEG